MTISVNSDGTTSPTVGLVDGGVLVGVGNPLHVTMAGAGNESVNIAQIGGNTTLVGAGATGNGSERVTVAQDVSTVAGSAPGTAGAASANVLTVQGIASMTPVKVDGSAVTQPVSLPAVAADTLSELVINTAAGGTVALVGAVSAKTTKVYKIFFVVAGATVLDIKDGSTTLTGPMTFNAGGAFELNYDTLPHFTGSTNTAMNIVSTNAVQISGRIYYINS